MRRYYQASLAGFTSLVLLVACTVPPSGPVGVETGGANGKKPQALKPLPPADEAKAPTSAQAILRAIPQTATVLQLTGKAKLLSDQGGSLLSDQGGSLISNNSAGIISNNTGNLLGKAKWGLLQTRAAEFLLADAVLTIQDAAGRQLTDESGQPLKGVTDEAGNFSFKATLPDENLLLTITVEAKPSHMQHN